MSVERNVATPMPRKRGVQAIVNHKETSSSPAKRRKVTKKSSPRKKRTEPIQTGCTIDSQGNELWEVEAILDERKYRRETYYLFKWAGIDPETGKPWPTSWEEAVNANQDAIDAWEETKKQVAELKQSSDLRNDNSSQPSQPSRSNQASSGKQLVSKRSVSRRIIDSESEGGSDVEQGLFVSPTDDSPARLEVSPFTSGPSEPPAPKSADHVIVAVPHVEHLSQYEYVGASQVTLPESHPESNQSSARSRSQDNKEPSPPSSPQASRTGIEDSSQVTLPESRAEPDDSSTRSTSQGNRQPSPPPPPPVHRTENEETSQANKAAGQVIPDSQTNTSNDTSITAHVTSSDTTDRRDFGASERSKIDSRVSGPILREPLSSAAEPESHTANQSESAVGSTNQSASDEPSPTTNKSSEERDAPGVSRLAARHIDDLAAPSQDSSALRDISVARELIALSKSLSDSTQQVGEAVKRSVQLEVAAPRIAPSQATTASETQHTSQNPGTQTSIEDLQSQIPYDPSTQLPDIPPAASGRASQGQVPTAGIQSSPRTPTPHSSSNKRVAILDDNSPRQASSDVIRDPPRANSINQSLAEKSDRSTHQALDSLARAPSTVTSITPDSRLPARPQTPSSAMASRPSTPSVRTTHGADIGCKMQDLWKNKGRASTQNTPSKPRSIERPPVFRSPLSAQRPSPAHSAHQPSLMTTSDTSSRNPPPPQVLPSPGAKASTPSGDIQDYYCFLPLDDNSKDLYRSTLNFQNLGPNGEDLTASKIQQLLDICDHPDLLQGNDPATQAMGPDTQVDWSVSVSSKFAFLQELIRVLHSNSVIAHIVLFVKPRLLDLVENFLKASLVRFSRPDRSSTFSRGLSGLRVTLLATGTSAPSTLLVGAKLIIAFDSSFGHSRSEVEAARRQLDSESICPYISLIIPHSLEHITYLQKAKNAHYEATTNDVYYAKQISRRIGSIPSKSIEAGFHPCRSAASSAVMIAQQLTREYPTSWENCLPKLESLPGISRALSEAGNNKRAAEALEIQQQKRPRLEAPVVDLTSTTTDASTAARGLDVTPWTTESTGEIRPPRERASAISSAESTQHVVADQSTLFSQPPSQPNLQSPLALSSSHTTNEAPVLQSTAVSASSDIQSSQAELHRLKQHANGLESGLTIAQTRYESRNASLEEVQKSLRARDAELASVKTRLENAADTIINLRTQRSAQQEELDTLRAAAKTGEIGLSAQTLEDLRAKARRVDALEKSLEASKNDCEYFRTQYQTASSEAAARASEVAELEASLADAKRKASVETRKLAQMHMLEVQQRDRDEAVHWRGQTTLYKAMLQSVSEDKKTAEDELLAERSKRGMAATTRAASLPPAAAVVSTPKKAVQAAGGSASARLATKKKLGGLLDVSTSASPSSRNARRGSTISANASRAVSPSAVSDGYGGNGNANGGTWTGSQGQAKTSPPKKSVAMNYE